jgi:hypothetical protein
MLAFSTILALWRGNGSGWDLPDWTAYIIFPLAAVLIFVINWLQRKK